MLESTFNPCLAQVDMVEFEMRRRGLRVCMCVCYKQKLRTGREGGVEAKYHRQDQGRLSLALASCEEGETEEETRGKKISSEAEKETGGKKEHQHMSHWYVKRYPTEICWNWTGSHLQQIR